MEHVNKDIAPQLIAKVNTAKFFETRTISWMIIIKKKKKKEA